MTQSQILTMQQRFKKYAHRVVLIDYKDLLMVGPLNGSNERMANDLDGWVQAFEVLLRVLRVEIDGQLCFVPDERAYLHAFVRFLQQHPVQSVLLLEFWLACYECASESASRCGSDEREGHQSFRSRE